MPKKKKKNRWDEKWMQRLLDEPDVKVVIQDFTPSQIEVYKRLLYDAGTYHRYTIEQQNDQIKKAFDDAFAPSPEKA